jgi:hypothetical protein
LIGHKAERVAAGAAITTVKNILTTTGHAVVHNVLAKAWSLSDG